MDNCKCVTYPFNGCYDVCTGRCLNMSSTEDLITIFKMKLPLAIKISKINLSHQLSTFSEYKPFLDMDDVYEIDNIFLNLHNNLLALEWLKMKFDVPDFVNG